MKVLECHSRGDKRFSSLYARVSVFGKEDTIENHYQLSKRIYGQNKPKDWRDLKGKEIDFFEVNNRLYPKEYITDFYKLLWVKYFDRNPSLLEFASTFDDFNDIFKSKNSINCQADVIRDIVKKGRKEILKESEDFIKLLNSKSRNLTIEKDLLSSKQNIIGHQVNCQGVMRAGIAFQIRNESRKAYLDYRNMCFSLNKSEKLLGKCQIVEVSNDKFVANLFGQYYYGRDKQYTKYDSIEKALMELKDFASSFGFSVALPYKMGCNLGGGDWNVVEEIIRKVFFDYPVILYKK